MIRIAVVEDEQKCKKDVLAFIKRYQEENQVEFKTEWFENGLVFSEYTGPQFDIVFMDIRMPLMNGMEAARRMRMMGDDSILIFFTSFAQYALQGYEVDAMDFIVKPVGYFNFSLKLRKALYRLEQRYANSEKIRLQTKNGLKLLSVDELYYVEVRQHDLNFHCREENIQIRGSLKNMEEKLVAHHFAKCNSSCLVNLRQVVGIVDGEVKIKNGDCLKLSRRSKKEFEEALTTYLGSES